MENGMVSIPLLLLFLHPTLLRCLSLMLFFPLYAHSPIQQACCCCHWRNQENNKHSWFLFSAWALIFPWKCRTGRWGIVFNGRCIIQDLKSDANDKNICQSHLEFLLTNWPDRDKNQKRERNRKGAKENQCILPHKDEAPKEDRKATKVWVRNTRNKKTYSERCNVVAEQSSWINSYWVEYDRAVLSN